MPLEHQRVFKQVGQLFDRCLPTRGFDDVPDGLSTPIAQTRPSDDGRRGVLIIQASVSCNDHSFCHPLKQWAVREQL